MLFSFYLFSLGITQTSNVILMVLRSQVSSPQKVKCSSWAEVGLNIVLGRQY